MTRPSLTLAATFTADPLLPLLRDALEHIEAPHRVESAPYGQLVEQLASPAGLFARNTDGVNVGLVRLADWTDGGARGAAAPDRVAAFVAAAREFAAGRGTPTALVVCPDPPGAQGPGPGALARLPARLRDVPGLAVIDAADWFTAYGCWNVHDPHGAQIAGVPYTDEAFAALAVGLARVVHSTLIRPRTVIAVDCDYTLWGGACGDAAPEDLDLGGRYLAVRHLLRQKCDEGFVLALCGRGDEAGVERVFAERGREMVLEREHFVASRVNWKPTSQNIASLAEELRLGPDSFVLLDDDPYVCAEVAETLPGVTVLHVGPETDPPAVLRHAWELDRFFATPEDRSRNDTYRADALRREAADGAADTARLNERLGTVVVVRRAAPSDLPRISQLLARTNQFASGTADGADVPALLAWQGADAWVATLRDRFGDYGTVATAVTARLGEEVHVECFAMSCRAMDRGVAESLFAAIADRAGVPRLTVRFRETGRNGPALGFLRTHAWPAAATAHDAGHDADDARGERLFVVGAAALTAPPAELSAAALGFGGRGG
ncbi:HAD-IIIC family phosphatase [Streptomyces sp. NPDC090022]|uniref:HAD-IIIC family phosphatase n=1 Tax=Streptomyces sp. NPDC090022 TaxID=3365920 RepID=UPI003800A649